MPKRWDPIKKVFDVFEDYHWFSEYSKSIIEKAKEEQKAEIKARYDLLQYRQSEYNRVAKSILSSFISRAADIEQGQDAWILSIIEKWFRYFLEDDDALVSIINFISNRFLEYNSSNRNKAIQECK